MRRFLCSKESISDGHIFFDRDESAHMSRVLRLEAGEHIIVSCGDGIDMECAIERVGEACCAKIISSQKNANEPDINIALFQAVIKNEKMDYAVQKATELGITRIYPVIAERTVVKIEDAKKETKKQERWQKIAYEACKQCERACVPTVEKAMSFKDAMIEFEKYELKIAAYEDEKTVSITQAVKKAESVAYFIGPEGGITDTEHKMLENAGAVSVSLGKRILRAETAAVACGAVILALMGEMNV